MSRRKKGNCSQKGSVSKGLDQRTAEKVRAFLRRSGGMGNREIVARLRDMGIRMRQKPNGTRRFELI